MVDATYDLNRDDVTRTVEPWSSRLIFYVGIPILLALVLGASASGSDRFDQRWVYFAYPLTSALGWGPYWAATWAATVILRPWRPHLLVVTTIGVVVGIHLATPITILRHYLFAPYLREGIQFYPAFPWRYDNLPYLTESAIVWVTMAFIWGASNAFWVYFLGYSRFGYRSAGVVRKSQIEGAGARRSLPPAKVAGPLASRLPASVAKDVIALRAEQHYTRVYSGAGDVLILIRFSDAIQGMGQDDGLQVHRSYWVRPSAVRSVERANGAYRLEMVNGLKIPVGRSFKREFDMSCLGLGSSNGEYG